MTRILWVFGAMMLLAHARPSPVAAQDRQQVPAANSISELFEVTPGAPVYVATIPVRSAKRLVIDIRSNPIAVNVEIIKPSGVPLDSTVLNRFTVGPGQRVPLGAILFQEGEHVQARVDRPDAGEWTIRVTLPAGATEASGSIGMFMTGGFVAGVTTSRPSYQAGDPVVLAVVVLNDTMPAVGATATASVYQSGRESAPMTVPLKDDGQPPDSVASDGLYTAALASLGPGVYFADITVRAGAEAAMTATNFEVTTSYAHLAGTKTDSGLDTNGDGLLDWIRVDVAVDVDTAGEYQLMGSLQDASGQRQLTAASGVTLAVGRQSIPLRFAASDIRTHVASDGPWTVRNVVLAPGDVGSALPSDRAADLGPTGAYTLSQLQRPITLILPGVAGEEGIDTNGDRLFDILEVRFKVDTLRAGTYTWSGYLRAPNGTSVGVATGRGSLPAGATTVGFTFNGETIGNAGLDGPYDLVDVAIYGPPDAAALSLNVGRTQAYSVLQFDGTQITFDRLIKLVTSLALYGRGGVPHTDGLRKSLLQKVTQAAGLAKNGNAEGARGLLNAFINEVRALTRERIMESDEQRLVEVATRLRDRL